MPFTSSSPAAADENSEDPVSVGDQVFRELVRRATFGNVNAVIQPVLTYVHMTAFIYECESFCICRLFVLLSLYSMLYGVVSVSGI